MKTDDSMTLEVALRTTQGKGPASQLRRQGWIPGVVYGEGDKTLPVQVAAKALHQVLHAKGGGNALIRLRVASEPKAAASEVAERMVLIRDLQHHPVTHQVIHVDFHHVSLSKEIKVTVPLVFKGEAIGVKQEGGVLEHTRWELEIACLPTQIPSELPVDLSPLALGKTLHAGEIPLPAGTRLVTPPEQPVVGCVAPKAEEELVPAEAAEGAAEPEVLKQKSPAEIAAEQEAAKEKEKQKESKREEKKEK